MFDIRKEIEQEEFDSLVLGHALRDYARPRDKISSLLASGVIVRVHKGFYVFGPDYARRPYSRELLANLMVGPSYVSLDSALAAHGMIPEGVDAVTSVCLGQPKSYDTPVGRFIYRPAPARGFCLGVTRVSLADGQAYLMATPGKALADKLRETRGVAIRTQSELLRYLTGDLRIDAAALAGLDAEELERVAEGYGSRKVRVLAALVRRLARGTGDLKRKRGHD
jgi:hypothetical protein